MTIQQIGSFFVDLPLFFQLRDILDILIVAFVIYLVIIFIRQSRSYFILYAFLFLAAAHYISQVLNLSLTRLILQPLLTFILLFFVVIFQREIRRFFEWFSAHGRRLVMERQLALSSDSAKVITDTAFEMASKKIGAIIVFAADYPLEQLTEGGFSLEGKISRPLLLSIFDSSSPGHDGAVIIDNNRVKKFGVHLPLAERFNKFSIVGTRHRATAGITQRSDAAAAVVSEERGEVSWSEGGELVKLDQPEQLETRIAQFLKEDIEGGAVRRNKWHGRLTNNWPIKLLSGVLAFMLWTVFVYQIGVTSQEFQVPVELRFLPKGLAVDRIIPGKINLTLSGSYRDLRSLNSGNIKAYVDMANAREGWQEVDLNQANLEYPPYVTAVSTSPKVIKFNITKIPAESVLPLRDL